MGAKLVAGIVGLIILVVLVQTYVLGGDDSTPSVNRRGSIPTATPPANQGEPIVLGQGNAGPGSTQTAGGTSGSTYTVQSGDTLGAIATRFNVGADQQAAWVAEVLRLNNMQDARQLQAGQVLKLPASSASTSASATPRTSATARTSVTPTSTPKASSTGTVPTSTPRGGGSAGTYTVVSGDTAFLIAEKHCVTDPAPWVDELLDINNVQASALAIGMVLDLPPGTPALCNAPGATATPKP